MDERKYTIRGIAGLPGSGLRTVLEKSREHIIVTATVFVIFIIVFLSLLYGSPDGRDKAIRTVVDGFMWGGVYALISLGMVVVYKSTRVFNMAHGGMLLFLTYLTWWLIDRGDYFSYTLITLFLVVVFMLLRISNVRQAIIGGGTLVGAFIIGISIASWGGFHDVHTPAWASPWAETVIVILAAIVLGLTLDRFLFRGMIGEESLRSFMITMVLGFAILHAVTILVFEGKSQIMPRVFFPEDTIPVIGSYHLRWELLCAFVVATAMFLIFVAFFRLTKNGLAMRCVSEDNVISQSLGIDVKRIYSIAWVMGAISAAAGGILLGTLTQVYSESGGLDGFAVFKALPIIVLGGIESIPGAYMGALIVGLLQNVIDNYVNEHIQRFGDVFPNLLLITVMVFRPHGLFGLKGIKRI